MKYVNPIIDKLQATFPPNRVCILLAGPIVALSAWLSAILATNVPGAELPTGIIAGVIGAAVLIVITLLYKWFDRWQEGERIDADADVQHALTELANAPEISAFYDALGTFTGLDEALGELTGRIEAGSINEAEIREEALRLSAVTTGFLEKHLGEDQAEPEHRHEIADAVPAGE